MARVHAGPRREGNQRQSACDGTDDPVPASRFEERLVAALVKKNEPVEKRASGEDLAQNPRDQARQQREPDA
jgi:hypothetical protein